MTEIPDWIDEKISFDNSREVQDRRIVEVFLESDRPYSSSRRVSDKIGLTKEATSPRLEELVELGVLDGDTIAGGRIFWIRDDRSEWPIPLDVEVEPVTTVLTVEEFLSRFYVRFGLLGVVVTMIGGLFMMAFTLVLTNEIAIPFVGIGDFLLGGVLLIFGGYAIVLIAIGYAILDRFANAD